MIAHRDFDVWDDSHTGLILQGILDACRATAAERLSHRQEVFAQIDRT